MTGAGAVMAVVAAIVFGGGGGVGNGSWPERSGSAAAPAADSLGDLPLHVVAARGAVSGKLAILLTGDGGWAAIDKQLADSLAAHGTPVVALDSRAYFAKQRDPDGAARDLERIAQHYLTVLGGGGGDQRLVLVGYSRGADVLPFAASRLTPELLERVALVAFLGPAPNANFKFHLVDLISNKHRADDRPTVPEIEKLVGKRMLCFYGADEKESACPALDTAQVMVVKMPGGHHFDHQYGVIAARIVEAAAKE